MLNAKTHRTSVCNAAESLLVHADVADAFVPRVVAALQAAGVTVHGDGAFAGVDGVVAATDDDYAEEYLSLDISAARRAGPSTRRSTTSARFSSQHTDAIVTEDLAAARRFIAAVDAAAVLVNASTRFTDGARVRLRRRDRHQHPEAARPRADGAARDDHDEVRRDRRRPQRP